MRDSIKISITKLAKHGLRRQIAKIMTMRNLKEAAQKDRQIEISIREESEESK